MTGKKRGDRTGLRNRMIIVRVTEKEHETIYQRFGRSTRKRISDYLRDVLVHEKVTIRQRNTSLDEFMAELLLLRKELNALGNNFNQVVKKVNSIKESEKQKSWISIAEKMEIELVENVKVIKDKVGKFSDRWLHGS